jgi:hypothetical protein
MRFDRIYVGAGARQCDAMFLQQLLKPGGILVGPFAFDPVDPFNEAPMPAAAQTFENEPPESGPLRHPWEPSSDVRR